MFIQLNSTRQLLKLPTQTKQAALANQHVRRAVMRGYICSCCCRCLFVVWNTWSRSRSRRRRQYTARKGCENAQDCFNCARAHRASTCIWWIQKTAEIRVRSNSTNRSLPGCPCPCPPPSVYLFVPHSKHVKRRRKRKAKQKPKLKTKTRQARARATAKQERERTRKERERAREVAGLAVSCGPRLIWVSVRDSWVFSCEFHTKRNGRWQSARSSSNRFYLISAPWSLDRP